MKKIYVTILVFTLLMSCKTEDCQVDPQFKKTYHKMISLVKTDQRNQGGLTHDGIRGVFYLNRITGIECRAVIGDLSYYENSYDLKFDLNNWRQWYKNNKCIMTAELSDSIVNTVLESTKWMDN